MSLKKETHHLSDHHRELAAQLSDLVYITSEDIFSYLEREAYVDLGDNGQRLQVFAEVVTFVLFWADRACKKRVFGKKVPLWANIFTEILQGWGAFFAEYPQGPALGSDSAETVCSLLTNKLQAYDKLHSHVFKTRGAHHALSACCAELLDHASTLSRPDRGKGSRETEEHVVHHLGRAIRSLMQRTDVIMLERPI